MLRAAQQQLMKAKKSSWGWCSRRLFWVLGSSYCCVMLSPVEDQLEHWNKKHFLQRWTLYDGINGGWLTVHIQSFYFQFVGWLNKQATKNLHNFFFLHSDCLPWAKPHEGIDFITIVTYQMQQWIQQRHAKFLHAQKAVEKTANNTVYCRKMCLLNSKFTASVVHFRLNPKHTALTSSQVSSTKTVESYEEMKQQFFFKNR